VGIYDANRYNETPAKNPRYTFGEFLVEGNGGSLRLFTDSRLTVQPLGESEREIEYAREDRNFAGDCCYCTQRHFVDRMLDGKPFETAGEEYLKTLAVQEAVYASAASGAPVKIS
jgi:predicted dehydrogenase